MRDKRILSGMRPTGRLHIGHLEGVLESWLKCQNDGKAFFFVADLHAITDGLRDNISSMTIEMVRDWIAAGIDPERAVLFLQSRVKAHTEMACLLGMMTPVPWLLRVPSYKDYVEKLSGEDKASFGFMGYPVLQAADILLYDADLVPVGDDQLAHLEFTRELVRRVNNLIGVVFKEPEPLLTKASRIPGLDGRKMSKSYNNTIELTDSGKVLDIKIMTMLTDPARKRKLDAGNPEICPVFEYQKIYNQDLKEKIVESCTEAKWGCTDCKRVLLDKISTRLIHIQNRRKELDCDDKTIISILREGSFKAGKIADEKLETVRDRIGFLKIKFGDI